MAPLESTRFLGVPLPATWTNQRVVDRAPLRARVHGVVLLDLDAPESIDFALHVIGHRPGGSLEDFAYSYGVKYRVIVTTLHHGALTCLAATALHVVRHVTRHQAVVRAAQGEPVG